MRRIIALFGALAVVLGVLAATGTAQATSYKLAANMTATDVAALVGCPSGDGSASWGDGKVCPDGSLSRFNIRDSLTDGYCVLVKYYSDDAGAWRQVGPKACTTGQWITFTTTMGAALCSPNARLYREDGAYFTMPTTVC
jgi:hypothetical protein